MSVCSHCGGGGTPSQVCPGGVPHPRSGRGYPISGQGGWGTPWTWDGVPPGPGMGYPPDLGRGTPQTWDRVPPWTWDGVHPPQHSKHLICGRRYASCVHTGGLSCYRPHPKDDGRLYFQSVHTSQVRGGGYPIPGPGGYSGNTPPPDRAAQRVLATRRAVCLLRSRRRTFLLQ